MRGSLFIDQLGIYIYIFVLVEMQQVLQILLCALMCMICTTNAQFRAQHEDVPPPSTKSSSATEFAIDTHTVVNTMVEGYAGWSIEFGSGVANKYLLKDR